MMLSLFGNRRSRDCDGTTRRDFLKVGTLGAAGMGLALPLLASRAARTRMGYTDTDNFGPTHVETFDPKMTAPSEFRSVTP